MLNIIFNKPDKCHVCLHNTELDERGVCSDCTIMLPSELINTIDSHINQYKIDVDGRTLYFTFANWDHHWMVVARRLDCGTETRMVEVGGKKREIEAVSVAGRYIACKDYVCTYKFFDRNWRLVECSDCSGCKSSCNETNEQCIGCGHQLYIGLTGVFCDQCGAFNAAN